MNSNLSNKNSQIEGNCSPSPKNPQSTDRGVLNTKHGVEALIDWLAFTIPTEILTSVFDLLRIPEENFIYYASLLGLGFHA